MSWPVEGFHCKRWYVNVLELDGLEPPNLWSLLLPCMCSLHLEVSIRQCIYLEVDKAAMLLVYIYV